MVSRRYRRQEHSFVTVAASQGDDSLDILDAQRGLFEVREQVIHLELAC